jgi:hypothetical protein
MLQGVRENVRYIKKFWGPIHIIGNSLNMMLWAVFLCAFLSEKFYSSDSCGVELKSVHFLSQAEQFMEHRDMGTCLIKQISARTGSNM